jgi:hypothetical protein
MKEWVSMAKYVPITSSKVPKMIKRGRGKGLGKDYVPSFMVRDVSSIGFANRIKGWKTDRVHQLHSNLEISLFFLLDWSENVVDIREKYPLLPVQKTIDIANRLGLNHPFYSELGEPIVMITDFLVDVRLNESTKQIAFSIMPEKKANSKIKRTFIERTYWRDRGIEFEVITNNDIPLQMVRNIEWVHRAKNIKFAPNGCADRLAEIEFMLHNLMISLHSVSAACKEADDQIGLAKGTSFWALKHFIANRYWIVDMREKIDKSKPLIFERSKKFIPLEGV